MGILDNLKSNLEKLGDRAKEGFDGARDKAGDLLDDAKDKAGDLLDDAKDRFGQDESTSSLGESADVGPDSSSTDAVQPGYVTAEDDVTGADSDESSLNDDEADDADDPEPVADVEVSDVVPPAAAELDPVDLDAVEVDAEERGADELEPAVESEPPAEAKPAVERDVDPYDEPLTETIGDELAAAGIDRETLSKAVDDTTDGDVQR